MAALELVGENFVINTLTKGFQVDPDVAGLAGGGLVATWVDHNGVLGDANSVGVVAQVLDATGAKIGDEFLVNSAKLGRQEAPSATGLADGSFVITWFDQGPTNNPRSDVKAQIFASNGVKIGSEFTVNTVTAGTQFAPAVSALPEGGLVAAWSSYITDEDDNFPIKAQVYDAAGARVGTELTVTPSTGVYGSTPSITTLANGNFVVSWKGQVDTTDSTNSYGVKAQILQPDGSKIGGEFAVSDRKVAFGSTIDALASGGFVATSWTSDGVSGQVFDSAGSKVGDAFQLATFAAGQVRQPTITALDDGRFAAAWADSINTRPGDYQADIILQLFDASGKKLGSQIQVNSGVSGDQYEPTITSLPGGRLLVAWTDIAETTILSGGQLFEYNPGIVGQLFDIGDDVVITSGSGKDAAVFAVDEGQRLVTTIAAIDEDSNPITYTITGGDDARLFTIDPASGALRFASTPDFDRPGDLDSDNVYQLTVGARGGDGDADSQAITVTVLESDTPEAYTGTPAADVFTATTGADWTISGLGGADVLSGNVGDDIITGGAGKDVLTGGAGADTFVFALGDSKAGGGVRDIITDFAANVDKLDLTALNIADFAAEVTLKAVGSGMIIYVDTNHTGFDYSDFGVQLNGVFSLTQSDFLL